MTEPARPVRLYTRADCPLCTEAAETLDALSRRLRFEMEVVDVDADGHLAGRYGDRVPVIEVAGAVVAEGAAAPAELRAALQAALRPI